MLRRWWPVFLLLLLPILPLGRILLAGEAIGPFHQIHQFAPWNAPRPDRPWDVLQADGVLQFYVWRDLVLSAWGRGEIPFWNPYTLAGTPLLANSQSAALYPPHILLGLLHVPAALAMLVLAWFHLAWAGLGVRAVVRRLGGSELGGVFAGVGFGLSAFMVAWTGLPSVITTVSWIPWALAAVAGIFSNLRRGEPFAASAGRLALSVAMMVLAGHLQFVAYGFMAILLFAGGLSVFPIDASPEDGVRSGSPVRSWGALVAALVAGVLIAAPQLFPVLQFSTFSHRRTAPSAEGYASYVAGAIQPFELENLVFPTLLGHPQHFAVLGNDANGTLPVSTYWPQLVKAGANFAESSIAFGPLILGLLCLAPWRREGRRLAPVALVGLFALLLALGTPLNMLLYYGVPGWSATGSPGRVECLAVMAACILAGLAIDRLPALAPKGLVRFLPLAVPGILTVLAVAICPRLAPGQDANFGGFTPAQVAAAALRDAAPMLLVSLILAGIGLAACYRLETKASQIAVVVTPIFLFLTWGGAELIPSGEPGFLAKSPVTPVDPTARVAIVNGGWNIPTASSALFPPNTATAARIHDLGGYDSLLHRDTVGLLKQVDGGDPAPPANGNMMFVKPSADVQALAEAGVTEVWSRRELPQLGTATSADNGMYRYPVAGPGRAATPSGPAKIVEESLDGLSVQATGPGKLVLRDRHMPGWSATVDGKATPIQGDLWREVEIPSGAHTVQFRYVAPGFLNGLGLAVLGFLLFGAILIFGRRTGQHRGYTSDV